MLLLSGWWAHEDNNRWRSMTKNRFWWKTFELFVISSFDIFLLHLVHVLHLWQWPSEIGDIPSFPTAKYHIHNNIFIFFYSSETLYRKCPCFFLYFWIYPIPGSKEFEKSRENKKKKTSTEWKCSPVGQYRIFREPLHFHNWKLNSSVRQTLSGMVGIIRKNRFFSVGCVYCIYIYACNIKKTLCRLFFSYLSVFPVSQHIPISADSYVI